MLHETQCNKGCYSISQTLLKCNVVTPLMNPLPPTLTNMIILATPFTGHVICELPFTYDIEIYLGYPN